MNIRDRLDAITNNMPGMAYQFVLHADGRMEFPYVSHAVQNIYGMSPKAVIDDATLLFDVVHRDDESRLNQSITESAEYLTQWNYTGRIIVDGKTKWIQGMSNPVKHEDGRIVWDGVVTDVTRTKRLEEEHTRILQRWKTIEIDPYVSVSELDLELNINYVSNVLAIHKGVISKEQLIGQNIKDILPKDEEESIVRLCKQVFDTGEMQEFTFPFELNGITSQLKTQVLPMLINGKVSKYMCLTTDVTHQHQQEAKEAQED